ncbi:hypothetical protein RV134_390077 [Roseovarius sp. EC-HK134]|nr:hypothetical protein RV420_460147 [Roseovarius sp. EC-SD190]VVT33469.1 hypothetical protein RV134_390077 [Roseovarius sp. EC-HK134]
MLRPKSLHSINSKEETIHPKDQDFGLAARIARAKACNNACPSDPDTPCPAGP